MIVLVFHTIEGSVIDWNQVLGYLAEGRTPFYLFFTVSNSSHSVSVRMIDSVRTGTESENIYAACFAVDRIYINCKFRIAVI